MIDPARDQQRCPRLRSALAAPRRFVSDMSAASMTLVRVATAALAVSAVVAIGTFVAPSLPGQGSRELQFSQSADQSATLTEATLPGSCAAAACHGRPFDGSNPDWRSAYSAWSADDPHRRAFEVLYADRSVEIYRNLNRSTANDVANDAASEAANETATEADTLIEPAAYAEFLEQRCIGCHATIPQGYSAPNAEGVEADARLTRDPQRLDVLIDGVTCESCHAMPPTASQWRDRHYLADWPPADAQATRALLADYDLGDLRRREAVCGSCHMGPKLIGDRSYDVTHDLIAAGHPRMAFEFATYLANYPRHWDERADRARHEQRTRGSFHIDAWRTGQQGAALRAAEQLMVRLNDSSESTPWPELSHFACTDCHHAMRPLVTPATDSKAAESPTTNDRRTDLKGFVRRHAGTPRAALDAIDRLIELHIVESDLARDKTSAAPTSPAPTSPAAAPAESAAAESPAAAAAASRSFAAQRVREQLGIVRTRLAQFEPRSDELLADVAELNSRLVSLPPLAFCRPKHLPVMGQFLGRHAPLASREPRAGEVPRAGEDRPAGDDARSRGAANSGGRPATEASNPQELSWESAVAWLLAVDALAHDLSDHDVARQLRDDIRLLREALSDSAHFGFSSTTDDQRRPATIYDSPRTFDSSKVDGLIRRIADRLTSEDLYAQRSASQPSSTARP